MSNKTTLVILSIAVATSIIVLSLKFKVHETILTPSSSKDSYKPCPAVIHCKGNSSAPCSCIPCPSPAPCPSPVPCPAVAPSPVPYIETKRDIAKRLAEIYLQLENGISHSKPPTPKTLVELKGIIGELDQAHKLSKDEREPTEPKVTDSNVLLDVCPEKYLGPKDYPWMVAKKAGWQLQDCKNVKPLNQVVSIVLNTMAYPQSMEKQVETVLKGINQTYPQVKVFLAAKTNKMEEAAKDYPNVKTLAVSKDSSLGKVWNQLINEVSTPYTLVARDVIHFTWVASIERQIRMISTTEHVAIAGGSFRNLTGHWRVGCRQTKLFNYVLQYEEGYHYSRHSCMFCDDLEGPFVAQTNFLKGLKFSEKYSKEILFEEFFLRVFQSGNLIMNCPDVMYFTTDYSTETKQNSKAIWRPLATDLKLVRVVLVDYGVRHKFSCGEISYKCSAGVTRYAALPMCCLEQFGNAMKFFHELSVKNYLHYELDSGSNLACVKFNNYNPFDIDGDFFLLSKNMSFVVSKASLAAQNGFKLGGYQPSGAGYLSFYTPDIHVEVWGFKLMSADKYSPPELNKLSHYTKCRVNNHWINCVHFPGLFSRNRYGPDVLKHSQSWRMYGRKSSWDMYTPGTFLKCNTPTFHACLDKFPNDGNIAFKVI